MQNLESSAAPAPLSGAAKLVIYPAELSAEIGVSESTLAKWRLNGSGPEFLKLGRKVAYHRVAVATWLASRRRRSTSEATVSEEA